MRFTTTSGRTIYGGLHLMASDIANPVYWDIFQPFPVRR
jgi:hypothetical protein